MRIFFGLVNHGSGRLSALACAAGSRQPQLWEHFWMSIRVVVQFVKGFAIGARHAIKPLQDSTAGIPEISHAASLDMKEQKGETQILTPYAPAFPICPKVLGSTWINQDRGDSSWFAASFLMALQNQRLQLFERRRLGIVRFKGRNFALGLTGLAKPPQFHFWSLA